MTSRHFLEGSFAGGGGVHGGRKESAGVVDGNFVVGCEVDRSCEREFDSFASRAGGAICICDVHSA